jgi:TRAP-type C4-dicarboxylate transport system permease small subunit
VAAATVLAMSLGLGVALLLFAQWPLRDAVGTGATQANDLAQWLFALYVAAAVVHAQRRGAHLVARPDLAQRGSPAVQGLRRVGGALCLLPWSLTLLVLSTPLAWRSLLALEGFPETSNPGYFMIKLALWLLAALLTLQTVAAVLTPAARALR